MVVVIMAVTSQVKGKGHPRTGHEGPEGGRGIVYSFFNLGARWGGRSTPRPGRFTPGRDPLYRWLGGPQGRSGRPRDRFAVVSLDFSVTYFFRPYHGPGVDSAPSENEYQEYFLWVKAASA
jgi:hypothetical protein